VLSKGAADIRDIPLISRVLNTSIPAQYEENKARTLVHGAPFAHNEGKQYVDGRDERGHDGNRARRRKKGPGATGALLVEAKSLICRFAA
jgi:hypothetical protein